MPKKNFEIGKVVVILGQTATGKSSLAVKVGKKINGEIISADSRQVYKKLDIGTGKISKKEMQGVPHHLIDVVNPKNKFTVAQYQKMALEAMADICKRGKVPIICGGTGFYIDAITKGVVFPSVPPNIKLRKTLEKKSGAELFKLLLKLDRSRALDIQKKNEVNNKVRIIRAIEIAKALGKIPKIKSTKPKYDFIKIGLCLPEDTLRKKVEKRVGAMFAKTNNGGLLEEIKKLKAAGISKNRLREFGFEYFEPTYEKVVNETMKYAKRQMTWFKRDKDIKWFSTNKAKVVTSAKSEYKKIESYIEKNL
jgi:tRNA dimethylallyltransferase